MNAHFKVVQGKPHGHRLRFAPGEFVVGRGPECHVRPNSELVSRQHCILKVNADGSLAVRDLGSTNGTLVNGRRLIDERSLIIGDTLQIGPVILQVVSEDTLEATGPVVPDTKEIRSLGDTVGDGPVA